MNLLAIKPEIYPIDEIKQLMRNSISINTQKSYKRDIEHFRDSGFAIPATEQMIIDYVHMHSKSYKPDTLARRLKALKFYHVISGYGDPTDHEGIKLLMKGIQRTYSTPPKKARPFSLEDIIDISNLLINSERRIDIRNLALIQIGFFGAFRRSELVNIKLEDLNFTKDGVSILIPRSKTDQTAEGQVCGIPFGNENICPVTSLCNWLKEGEITSGYIFRSINKSNKVGLSAIPAKMVCNIAKESARIIKLDNWEGYSAHSLRRGFATSASRNGSSIQSIMRQGRWIATKTVYEYIDEGNRFIDNASGDLLKKPKIQYKPSEN